MAITRNTATLSESADSELQLIFNNGDLAALTDSTERLGFKNEESLLRYALAVISKSATRTLTIIDKDGKSTALNPSESLLKGVDDDQA